MMTNIPQQLQKQYKDKKVLVVGLGLQGGGAGIAKFFVELGAEVTVTDKKDEKQLAQSVIQLNGFPVSFHLGGHKIEDFLDTDVIFKGPSVRWDLPEIVAAQKKGIPVEMELSFFAANFPGKIIGVTGTRGKSTTTQMIYALLKNAGYPVYLGGGLPDISTINYLKSLTVNDWVVMELSSWALSGFHRKKISPHIAVFTNFYPDHLNYYQNMDDYIYDKKAIYYYQKREDYLVVNQMLKNVIASGFDKLTVNSAKQSDSIKDGDRLLRHFVPRNDNIVYFSETDFPDNLDYLKGNHNRQNAAAALKVAEILQLPHDRSIDVIKQFKGLPFRQEIIGTVNNVTFINDTTSTTPVATIKAIETFCDKPVYLILGGQGKSLPFDTLVDKLTTVKKIILLKGTFTDKIFPKLQNKFPDKITTVYDDMEKAVSEAYRLAENEQHGANVLLSPAATSFAQFNNEFHRGREFNRYVDKIIRQK